MVNFEKSKVYSSYFSSPYIREYFEINGIEIPEFEAARRRIPFILNILEAFGVVKLNRSDFVVCKVPYHTSLFTTESYSAMDNYNVVKSYAATQKLPKESQLLELKMKFGKDFLTPEYNLTVI